MTREEALQILDTIPTIGEQVDALELAIEALSAEPCCNCIEFKRYAKEMGFEIEQEPCEDCISRKDVYELIEDINDTVFGQQVSKGVANLPSIQPKPKTGHWIKHENANYGQCELVSYECSSCGVWLGCQYFSKRSYCPNCGAKMESEE